MKGFADRVVAVTGAASGIGRALALELARRGAAVALADLDAEGLAATADNCRARGAPVSVSVLDVGDRAAMTAWAAEVADWQGRVHMVVNNAGVALVAGVEEASDEDLRTNFWGVVQGTRAFLPHLKAAGEGHVVNISSVFGLVGVPLQSAYCAAKFAVRGFTESLRAELRAERCGVSATVVLPGGVRTAIAQRARIGPSSAAL
ncbi:MAG: acetoin dehydrogenase, partial [Acidimicrobiia bacterium]